MEWNGRKKERGVKYQSNQSINQVIEMVESKAYQKDKKKERKEKKMGILCYKISSIPIT
jgi:hypothetical protein